MCKLAIGASCRRQYIKNNICLHENEVNGKNVKYKNWSFSECDIQSKFTRPTQIKKKFINYITYIISCIKKGTSIFLYKLIIIYEKL